MNNQMKLTIIGHKDGMFNVAPRCDVIIDNQFCGCVERGGVFNIMLDNKQHNVRCQYNYGKSSKETECSNTFTLKSGFDYVLILKPLANTYRKQVREDLIHLFSKGYTGVREIMLVEDVTQAEKNRSIIESKQNRKTDYDINSDENFLKDMLN